MILVLKIELPVKGKLVIHFNAILLLVLESGHKSLLKLFSTSKRRATLVFKCTTDYKIKCLTLLWWTVIFECV